MSSAGPGEQSVVELRTKKSVSTQLRVLYVVTDTATQGVAPRQLRCAMQRIQQQVGPHGILRDSPVVETGCPNENTSPPAASDALPEISLLASPRGSSARTIRRIPIWCSWARNFPAPWTR